MLELLRTVWEANRSIRFEIESSNEWKMVSVLLRTRVVSSFFLLGVNWYEFLKFYA